MGINCQDVRRDVSDYIDDELNPAQRAALDGTLPSVAIAPRCSTECAILSRFTGMNGFSLRPMVFTSVCIRNLRKRRRARDAHFWRGRWLPPPQRRLLLQPSPPETPFCGDTMDKLFRARLTRAKGQIQSPYRRIPTTKPTTYQV